MQTLESTALGHPRDLTIYLPPNHDPNAKTPVVYLADGQSVSRMATLIEPLIVDGTVPPVMLVGVHSAHSSPPEDLRGQEYLIGFNEQRFAAHESFFVNEVRAWAEQNLGAATQREQRAVFGLSNGAAFAIAMGIRHPDLYGNVLAFSFAWEKSAKSPMWEHSMAPRHYLLAGRLEEGFHRVTKAWAATLERLGVEHVFHDRVAGHDHTMWEEEFPAAVGWAFGNR